MGLQVRATQPNNLGGSNVNTNKLLLKLLGGGFGLLVMFLFLFRWQHVEGNERLVTQDWKNGLSEETVGPGTYFYVPFKTTIYKYNVGTEKFIMGKKELYSGTGSDTVNFPAYTITTGGSGKEQPASFSVTLQYHLDPRKLVQLHKEAQAKYEDLVIKPSLTRIISDLATTQTVLNFYSGEGRVSLQRNIEKAIAQHPALEPVGIVVDTFVIDEIELDKEYVAEITGRQLASQKKLRAIEETLAAEEDAKRVQAVAGADKLKKVVEAEASKETRIKAAEAQAQETRLAAEASRFQKEQDAKGLLAQGYATAEVAEKSRNAKYAGEPGARAAQVEMAIARVEMFKNMAINGVIPEKTLMTIINGTNVTPVINAAPHNAAAGAKDEE